MLSKLISDTLWHRVLWQIYRTCKDDTKTAGYTEPDYREKTDRDFFAGFADDPFYEEVDRRYKDAIKKSRRLSAAYYVYDFFNSHEATADILAFVLIAGIAGVGVYFYCL